MQNSENIKDNSDSLIELLTEQCADLENLLALAREETEAAKQGNFGKIIDIFSERDEISKRLETFQQQITELRTHLNEKVPVNVSNRIKEVVNLTITQDTQTKLLLTEARTEATEELNKLEQTQKNTNIYLKERRKGLAFNRQV